MESESVELRLIDESVEESLSTDDDNDLPDSLFKCPQCSLIFHCLLTLDNHIRFHTKEHPYECTTCHKSFLSNQDLKSHCKLSNCKQTHVDSKTENGYKCGTCQKVLSSQHSLIRHERLHTGERPFSCVECGDTFIDGGDLHKHMRRHAGQTKLQCQICNKVCISEKCLNNHILSHKGKLRYQCPTCGKFSRCKSHYDEHLRIHSGEKPFECTLCNIRYRYKSQLREHNLNKHSPGSDNEKKKFKTVQGQVVCDICGALLSRSSIRHHRKLHQEKHHKCDLCEKSYSSRCQLAIHSRSHTGERPFKCSLCGKGMTTNDGLKRHMKLHSNHKEYKCSYCDREFYYISNLNQHLRTHKHGGESFTCEHCCKSFRRLSLLKSHLLTPCSGVVVLDGQIESVSNQPKTYLTLPFSVNDGNKPQSLPNHQNTDIKPTEAELIQIAMDTMNDKSMTFQSQPPIDFIDSGSMPSLIPVIEDQNTGEESTKSHSVVYADQNNSNQNSSESEMVDKPPSSLLSQQDSLTREETIEHPISSSTPPSLSNSQTNTVYHQLVDEHIEVEHANEVVLSENDLSNLMTLAGVSSDTLAGVSSDTETKLTLNNHKLKGSVLIVTFSENSESQLSENKGKVIVSPDIEFTPVAIKQEYDTDQSVPTNDESNTTVDVASIKEEPSKEDAEEFLDVLQCIHCDETFKFHYSLREHCSQYHPDQDVYKCFDCDDTFESIILLRKHMSKHNGNSSLQCQICNKIFSHPQNLKQHVAKHKGKRPKKFKCNRCDRRFVDSTHLREHMMVHSGNKPYSCPTCDRKFVRMREMETHMRIHSGELPYKCTKCDKAFRAAYYLKNHMLTHADKKPYPCPEPECDKAYFKRSKLRLHMMNHTGNKPYQCEVQGCGKSYSERRDFIHHIMVHRGEKPHRCRVCSKAFTLKGNMLQHERIHNRV